MYVRKDFSEMLDTHRKPSLLHSLHLTLASWAALPEVIRATEIDLYSRPVRPARPAHRGGGRPAHIYCTDNKFLCIFHISLATYYPVPVYPIPYCPTQPIVSLRAFAFDSECASLLHTNALQKLAPLMSQRTMPTGSLIDKCCSTALPSRCWPESTDQRLHLRSKRDEVGPMVLYMFMYN